jgi:hypothetical protein
MVSTRKKVAIAGAAALALAAGGVGVAQAVGGDSDQNATGPDANRAKAAGVQAAGGGRAVEVERSDEHSGGWEVKVDQGGGKLVEVQLDGSFHKTGVAPDDDSDGPPGDGDGETNDDG